MGLTKLDKILPPALAKFSPALNKPIIAPLFLLRFLNMTEKKDVLYIA
ncbi:MAG: hypothetical protein L7G92_02615 [Stygiolobus sp.]|nr:hypothetical protein [Stygiolobus sp.]